MFQMWSLKPRVRHLFDAGLKGDVAYFICNFQKIECNSDIVFHTREEINLLLSLESASRNYNASRYQQKQDDAATSKKTLATLTTNISKPGHVDFLVKTLTTFGSLHDKNELELIDKMIIVNEYSSSSSDSSIIDNLETIIKTLEFPFAAVIHQKPMNCKGKSNSFHYILNVLRDESYDYWLQFDESWYFSRPFVKNAIDIMEQGNLSLLQLSKNESYLGLVQPFPFINIQPRDTFDEVICSHLFLEEDTHARKWKMPFLFDYWFPLFRLSLPFVCRVSSVLQTPQICNQIDHRHLLFEWEFAKSWLEQAKHIKGIIHNPPAHYQNSYKLLSPIQIWNTFSTWRSKK